MTIAIDSTTTLKNGVEMPRFGLGVYKSEAGEEVETAVKTAIQTGYRMIDTASFYKNEESVGKAIRESGVSRDDLFITTKVWNDEQGYDETKEAFERSRSRLGLEVIDLYLIHWPVTETFEDTWRAMETLYEEGKVRAIGVSNFHKQHIETLMQTCRVEPMVNQVELHPWLSQKDLHHYCQTKGIQIEAWSPLARGGKFGDPFMKEIAGRHGKTEAQVILRWMLQKEIVTIPKSVTVSRIQENADLFDFDLSSEEVSAIDQLDANERIGKNPDYIDELTFE
ncbi:aldo/keto reductase [Salisediminibacterium selenitireducens]|uniref:2,5-didehydrogluconate reductase n=1 Tax=Bacillus selenitireducens (strain ATCC 700615 / DSM 15326 / MLS10) TaxID=439292 RepID=D6XTF1_BACIE|nr:aldo/keto reductase [Salisediminibacterium selenitireducens]ADH99087.1 2,5-didehydrogluconate reductase [[Bacillus] selenitireducens MLS10]